MGPSLPRKKSAVGSKNTSQRRLSSAGRDSRSTTASSIGIGSTHIGSSPTVVPEDEELRLSPSYSDDWNKKRYQREDEELWGREISRTGHKLMDAIKQAGSSAGRMIEATLGKEPKPITEEDRYNFYNPVKNPPVNDYHPPVVSQRPMHKDAAKWMLQPPPPAKIMEGKVPVSRSTSLASQASSKRTMVSEEPALGRLMHEKMMEAKLRSGEVPPESELAASLSKSSGKRRNTTSTRGSLSQRTTRSRSLSLESTEVDEPKKRRRPRARPPMKAELTSSDDENVDPRRLSLRRPKLATIASSRSGTSSPVPKATGGNIESVSA